MSEHFHQAALFEVLRANEGKHPELRWVYAIPNGGNRHLLTAIKLKKEGVRRGIFDVHVPIARNGKHGLYLEMKFGRNKLSSEQVEFSNFAIGQGFAVEVCYSADEAIKALESYLGIKLSK